MSILRPNIWVVTGDSAPGYLLPEMRSWERLYFLQNSVGAVLPPGLLAADTQLKNPPTANGASFSQCPKWLQRQSQVEKVYYPGLPEHSGYNLFQQQADGFGGMLSFRVNSRNGQDVGKITADFLCESLGGVETLITLPAAQDAWRYPRR